MGATIQGGAQILGAEAPGPDPSGKPVTILSYPTIDACVPTPGYTNNDGNVYWYKVNLVAPPISVTFQDTGATDKRIGVYDSTGNLLAQADNIFGTDTVVLTNLASGNYYIAVGNWSSQFFATNWSTTGGPALTDDCTNFVSVFPTP